MQAGAQHGMHTMDKDLARARQDRRDHEQAPREVPPRRGLPPAPRRARSRAAPPTATTRPSAPTGVVGRDADGRLRWQIPSSTRSATGPGSWSQRDAGRRERGAVLARLREQGYAPARRQAPEEGHRADRASAGKGQAQGARDLLAPVRDDDQLRPVAAARARRSWRSRPRTRSWRGSSARCARRRAGLVAVGGARQAPQVFPPLMVNMVPGRSRSAASSTPCCCRSPRTTRPRSSCAARSSRR